MARVMIQGTLDCTADDIKKMDSIKSKEGLTRESEFAAFAVRYLLTNYKRRDRG